MASRIAIQIVGSLNLREFFAEMKALNDALRYSERHLSGDDRNTYTRFEIVDLHHSNATVEMEAQPIKPGVDFSAGTVDAFFDAITDIRDGKRPSWIDLDGLLTFRELGKILGTGTPAVILKNSQRAVQITEGFARTIDEIVGPDQIAHGSILGMLEMLSVHRRPYQFALYPTIGPKRVVCGFGPEQLQAVIASIGRYVEVFGTLKYKASEKFAYAVESVREIDIKPNDDDLPRFSDFAGAGNDLTDVSIEEFIETFANGRPKNPRLNFGATAE